MTRADLAALINVNPQTVGALERGDHFPSLDLAFRICDVFGLPVEAVFSRTAFAPLSTELYGRTTRAQGGDANVPLNHADSNRTSSTATRTTAPGDSSEYERKYANTLGGWRNQRRRRTLVVGLGVTFVFMFAVAILCAFGLWWAPLLWLPACAAFFPMWIALQIVSGRRGDAPEAALDEYEIQQRNSARSIGLTVTQNLMLIPIGYLIFGSVITHGADTDMA